MKKYQKSIDQFRLLAACLVICIHTAPLLEINLFANYLLVQIVARVAVPFFFCLSGYYYFKKLSQTTDQISVLLSFLKQNLRYYLYACLIYIPFYLLKNPQFDLLQLSSDFLYHGFHYHLWYFPAVLLAAVIVTFLYLYMPKHTFMILLALYFFGSLLNVYLPLIAIGGLQTALQSVLDFFTTVRNGIFFAPLFFYLGFTVKDEKADQKRLLLLGMIYLVEGLLVEGLDIANAYTCMYLSLVW